MVSLEKEYEYVVKQNEDVLKSVILYILKEFKITTNILLQDIEFYVRKALEKLKSLNNKIVEIRYERSKLRDDLSDLERAYCTSDNCEVNEVGYNNGARTNNVLDRQINKIKLKQKLGELVIQSSLLEHNLMQQNELMCNFINCIPQEQYIQVMTLTYIECLPTGKIASMLNYTYDYTKHARCRAIKALADILKLMLSPMLL